MGPVPATFRSQVPNKLPKESGIESNRSRVERGPVLRRVLVAFVMIKANDPGEIKEVVPSNVGALR